MSTAPHTQDNSLRIEMVLPSLDMGGMEVVTRDLALGLLARNHQVGITCIEREGELAGLLRERGVPVTLVDCPGIRPNLLPSTKLTAHFQARGCNIVHLHNGVWAKGALASRYAQVPVTISTLHGLAHNEGWLNEALRWWGGRKSDLIVAVSTPLRHHLIEQAHIPEAKVIVLRNGIDTDRFSPGERSRVLRSTFGIAADVPLVGCIARLDPVKNHAMLLASFKRVTATLPYARLILVGDGPLRHALQTLAADLGLSRVVIFAGAFPDAQSLYRDLDAFVLASFAEGTSISVLEAMASGVPVVATAVGGNPDLLANGTCGLLVPSGDSAALADAVIRLLRDADLRVKLADAGRARATSTFSQASMVLTYEGLYRTMLRKKLKISRSPPVCEL